MNEELRKLKAAIDRAMNDYNAAVKRTYPVGTQVTVTKGGRWLGKVVAHGYGDDLMVMNLSTHAKHRISPYWIEA